jgi:hypothetical protein
MNGIELQSGIVVDPDRQVAYVMSPEGGIDAVELVTGQQLWTSRAAAKPLALARDGNLLVSQAEPAGPDNNLTIVTLDTQRGGERVAVGTTELPPGVEASVGDSLNGSFRTEARISGSDALVSWQEVKRVISGVLPSEEETAALRQSPQEPTPGQLSTASGAFRMDISTGSVSPLSPEEAPRALATRAPALADNGRLEQVPGPQFLSADGRYVLSSQRVADDRVWDKYQWTIYDRGTGTRVGDFRTFVSVAPFLLVDERIVYVTGPFMQRRQDGVIEEPLKIRAVDLQTSQEVWNRGVRDTEYRGPYPP